MCYRLERYIFNDGLLNDGIDATYIIHLENNGRLDDIMNQLREYHSTNIVYILYNKGYKLCNKEQNIVLPADDLIDAFLYCFKHADENNYNNILILEDDFIFNPEIKEIKHINNINEYCTTNINNKFILSLGGIPYISIPYNSYLYYTLSTGMHSVIYSKLMREIILNDDIKNIKDWDVYLIFNKLQYYTPLCYQLFPETENNKNWGENYGVFKYLMILPKYIFKLLNLNTQIEPGYSIMYIISKLIFLFLLFLLIYLTLYRQIQTIILK